MTRKIVRDSVRWDPLARHGFGAAALGTFVFVGAPLLAFAGQSMHSKAVTPVNNEVRSVEQATADPREQTLTSANNSGSKPKSDQSTKTNVSLEVTTKTGQKPVVSAHVNGRPVTLSKGKLGTKRIHHDNGQSIVDITVEGEGNGSASSHVYSSTNVEINGQSYSNSTGSNINGDEGRHLRRR